MQRFAVLRHDSPRGLHWDLLVERGQVLWTWALPRPPEPRAEMSCDRLPDHRLDYLEYEGPVSGNRGSVSRWDGGTCELQVETDTELVFALRGQHLAGTVTLRRLGDQPGRWGLTYKAGAG